MWVVLVTEQVVHVLVCWARHLYANKRMYRLSVELVDSAYILRPVLHRAFGTKRNVDDLFAHLVIHDRVPWEKLPYPGGVNKSSAWFHIIDNPAAAHFKGSWSPNMASYMFYDPWGFKPLSCRKWADDLKSAGRSRPFGHPTGFPEYLERDVEGYDTRRWPDDGVYSEYKRIQLGLDLFGDPWPGMPEEHYPPCRPHPRVTLEGKWHLEDTPGPHHQWDRELKPVFGPQPMRAASPAESEGEPSGPTSGGSSSDSSGAHGGGGGEGGSSMSDSVTTVTDSGVSGGAAGGGTHAASDKFGCVVARLARPVVPLTTDSDAVHHPSPPDGFVEAARELAASREKRLDQARYESRPVEVLPEEEAAAARALDLTRVRGGTAIVPTGLALDGGTAAVMSNRELMSALSRSPKVGRGGAEAADNPENTHAGKSVVLPRRIPLPRNPRVGFLVHLPRLDPAVAAAAVARQGGDGDPGSESSGPPVSADVADAGVVTRSRGSVAPTRGSRSRASSRPRTRSRK